MNQAAKALAMTAYDLCELPGALQRVKEEFANWQLENV